MLPVAVTAAGWFLDDDFPAKASHKKIKEHSY